MVILDASAVVVVFVATVMLWMLLLLLLLLLQFRLLAIFFSCARALTFVSCVCVFFLSFFSTSAAAAFFLVRSVRFCARFVISVRRIVASPATHHHRHRDHRHHRNQCVCVFSSSLQPFAMHNHTQTESARLANPWIGSPYTLRVDLPAPNSSFFLFIYFFLCVRSGIFFFI